MGEPLPPPSPAGALSQSCLLSGSSSVPRELRDSVAGSESRIRTCTTRVHAGRAPGDSTKTSDRALIGADRGPGAGFQHSAYDCRLIDGSDINNIMLLWTASRLTDVGLMGTVALILLPLMIGVLWSMWRLRVSFSQALIPRKVSILVWVW